MKTLILAGMIALASACIGENVMPVDPLWEAQTRTFATRIGYDQARERHVEDERIAYDWNDSPVPPHLQGWTRVNSSSGKSPIGAEPALEGWEWGYSRGKDGMDIKVTAYADGGHAALDAILAFAHRSTMVEPPWLKGPADLGTLSIVSEGPYGFNVYWAYRNLEFAIEGIKKADVLKTAYWLNGIAEAHRQTR